MSNLLVNVWLACVKLIFTALHIVCNGLQYFDTTWTLFKRKWDLAVTMHGVDTELYVSRFVTGLECPTHLAVIVGDDQSILNQDFTNLIVWCLAAGISFLTVYDQKGFVLEQETKFYNHFIENSKGNAKKVSFRNLHAANGFKPKLYVNVLAGAECNDVMVEVVHQLAKDKSIGGRFDSFEMQERINKKIFEKRLCPDPELAIVGSRHMCTHRFSPWNIRLTEFVRVNPLSGMNANEFCQVLQRYARCQKRHGK